MHLRRESQSPQCRRSSPNIAMTNEALPLAGLRVIDVGTRISAPFCAGLLGEMGAEVIKIEDPHGGDFMRSIGPFLDQENDEDEYSMWWAVEGRGRKGVTLNLREPKGQELFRSLVATADVVCENFRPGTLEAWNIAPDQCDEKLVWARISVFGQDGPNAPRPGLDRMGIAYGGLLHLTGYPDRPPVKPGINISDYLTGTFAAEAVMAALYRRDRAGTGTGKGGVVDAPLYGAVLRILEWTLAAQDRLGLTRQREGNRLSTSAPIDNYPTKDGTYVCIVAGSDANFARLCRAMGQEELANDPRYTTLSQRASSGDELNDLVSLWTMSMNAKEVEQRCLEHGVPVAVSYDAHDILNDPHMIERGDFVTVNDPIAGPHRQQGPFPRLDGVVPEAPLPAPRLGEHNKEIWCDALGLSETELAELTAQGIF
ncbi:MAG: CoA transferase [Actinobacteria bacterium]|nr:CoA transferase [Actinomycetota bacterium]MSX10288.1 CoA transferase [Actinomycetota bacterium]MSX67494.1 CoA transferase [Actinomycetota bacterium]